jgi:broad specificity phosphatase PhoE
MRRRRYDCRATVGNPHDTDRWEWCCGFYRGEYQSDTAATFAEARADFEREWRVFLSKRTESDFQAWRDQRDWTARKYALWDTGKAT